MGFKPAGGVKDAAVARVSTTAMAEGSWAGLGIARTFRFGASSLLASLLATLGHGDKPAEYQRLLKL